MGTRGLGDTDKRQTLVDILDDDSHLNIFYHRRPVLLEEDDIGDINNKLLEGEMETLTLVEQACSSLPKMVTPQ